MALFLRPKDASPSEEFSTPRLLSQSWKDEIVYQGGNKMRRSKSEIYLHTVWATKRREPLVTKNIQTELYSFIEAEAKRLRCQVLAINGMADHVHLIVRVPTTVCASELTKQVKGTSSAYVNDLIRRTPYFRWQEGSGTFSLCEPILSKAIRYVENQEQHHMTGSLWHELEEADEETPPRHEDWLTPLSEKNDEWLKIAR